MPILEPQRFHKLYPMLDSYLYGDVVAHRPHWKVYNQLRNDGQIKICFHSLIEDLKTMLPECEKRDEMIMYLSDYSYGVTELYDPDRPSQAKRMIIGCRENDESTVNTDTIHNLVNEINAKIVFELGYEEPDPISEIESMTYLFVETDDGSIYRLNDVFRKLLNFATESPKAQKKKKQVKEEEIVKKETIKIVEIK
jgi:hypothetical protein